MPSPSRAIPTRASAALALVAGILAALNQTVFHFGSHWYAAVTIGLVFLAGLGVAPLTGAAFRNALHLAPAVALLVSSAVAALGLALTTIDMSKGVKAVIEGVVAFAAGIGFGPSVLPVAPVAPVPAAPRPARPRHRPAAPKPPLPPKP